MFDKLLKPLCYIKIYHPEKRWFDYYLPLILSIIICAVLYYLPVPVVFVGKDSLISVVNGILQILSGFYIASMAAVATFNKAGMDDPMSGQPPTLYGKPLTRRNFLTYLFGYLAFMSIFMYFAGGFVQLAGKSILQIAAEFHELTKYIFVAVYMVFICNILTTTALGMHFLIDRVHRGGSKFVD
ncbi:hypothetical protein [Shewanella sp. GD04112]|uniref:hypothetical protein n=1 Tax=Shewanella sp. GD04112 TaxID=2975434 RepID=UPI0024486077|nr:hypothetical protein [Shewanella sp. GD04112]MDH0447248.1 hypothetical protein [Shewanella sp. GD04112]